MTTERATKQRQRENARERKRDPDPTWFAAAPLHPQLTPPRDGHGRLHEPDVALPVPPLHERPLDAALHAVSYLRRCLENDGVGRKTDGHTRKRGGGEETTSLGLGGQPTRPSLRRGERRGAGHTATRHRRRRSASTSDMEIERERERGQRRKQ